MTRYIPTLGVLGFALLGGCISFGPKPPKALLTLTPATTVVAGATRSAAAGEVITITYPGAPAAISTLRVPVYSGATELSYLKDVAWNDTPSKLFQRLMSETVAAKTGRIVLDLRQSTLDPGLRLAGNLQRFGIDPGAMQAIVVYDGILLRGKGAPIETRRFEGRAPLSAIEPGEVGRAMNAAANDAAAQVAEWVK